MKDMLDPIEKSVDVPIPRDAAFDLFTRRMGEWWPLDTHALSAGTEDAARDVTVEPRVGGKVFETTESGSRHIWATVTDWVENDRIGLSWYVSVPEEEATSVEVRFLPLGPEATRVEITHGGFTTEASMRAAKYDTGWHLVLKTRYRAACLREAAEYVLA